MKRFIMRHRLFQKFLLTFGIVGVFIIGKYIPVPHVSLESYMEFNHEISTMTGLTGGDLTQIGLFSLGLGPSMYGSILAQLFSSKRSSRNLPVQLLEFRKNSLIAIVALIQGLGLAVSLVQPKTPQEMLKAFQIAFVLITGAFVIHWLSSMNAGYGVGGQMVIIVANILLSQFRNIPHIIQLWQTGQELAVVLALGWVLLMVYLIVFFEHSEYRIPINRISIHNEYAEGSYMPIKVNVAGGMPLMYAYTFLVFPQYIIMLLLYFYPNWGLGRGLTNYFSTKHLIGIIIYLTIIAVLTISMAHINLDSRNIAEDMRASGDYIPFVRPGKATQDYIRHYVSFFGRFNACFLILLSGIPMIVALGRPSLQPLTSFTGVFMIFTALILNISEEIKTLRLRERYRSIF